MEAKVASRGQVLRQIQNDKKSYEAALEEMKLLKVDLTE